MIKRSELPDKLTVKEVSDMLGVKPGTVKVMAVRGELQYVGEVGSRDISTDSLVKYVNKRYGGIIHDQDASATVDGSGDSRT